MVVFPKKGGFMRNFLVSILFLFSNLVHANTTSVIIPCYPGHIQYLEPLCNALCYQTELPDEVVISISECQSIDKVWLAEFTKTRYPFTLVIVCSKEKLYAGQNRNKACARATGDIFICQDADDLPHLQRIEIVKKAFKTYNIPLLLHRWVPTNRIATLPSEYVFENIPFFSVKNWEHNEVFDFIHYGNVSLKREVFDRVKWSDMKNSEDKRFLQEAMGKGFSLGLMDAFLLVYRVEYSSGN